MLKLIRKIGFSARILINKDNETLIIIGEKINCPDAFGIKRLLKDHAAVIVPLELLTELIRKWSKVEEEKNLVYCCICDTSSLYIYRDGFGHGHDKWIIIGPVEPGVDDLDPFKVAISVPFGLLPEIVGK